MKTFELANINAADAKFFEDIGRLFTDPKFEDMVRLLREGKLAIRYEPGSGAVHFMDAHGRQSTAAEAIAFVARFSDDEWDRLMRHGKGQLMRGIREYGPQPAEDLAKEVLGYLPPPRQLTEGHE